MKRRQLLFLFLLCLVLQSIRAQTVSDVITGLSNTHGLAVVGNDIYVSDPALDKIFKADLAGSNQMGIPVLDINNPRSLLLHGNDLYIGTSNSILKIDVTQGSPVAETILSGLATTQGMAIVGNELFYAESTKISKIELTDANPIPSVVIEDSNIFGFILKDKQLFFISLNTIKLVPDYTVANPTSSNFIGGLGAPFGLAINGDFLYTSVEDGLVRINTIEGNPTATSIDNLNLICPLAIVFNNGIMYIADDEFVRKVEGLAPGWADPKPVCSSEIATTIGGASPTGGTYSGTGVTDDGNGETFTFDVAGQGVGSHMVTYTLGMGVAQVNVEVIAGPTVSFTAGVADLLINAGVQSNLSGGMPAGGKYSGPGVMDTGNGMTYSFDPAVAGVGVHTVTYTFADANNCAGMSSDMIIVEALELPGEGCAAPVDIANLFGQAANVPQLTTKQSIDDYSSDASDPTTGFDCHYDSDPLQKTLWYSFTGDGEKYLIRSVVCDGSTANFDAQAAVYSGDCMNLSEVACNEDEDGGSNILNISFELETENGTDYLLMIDSYQGAAGSFCLEVTKQEVSAVINVEATDVAIYPNPTTSFIQLPNLAIDRIEVFNVAGSKVYDQINPEGFLNLEKQVAGLYLLKMYAGEDIYSARVVKK